MNSKRLRYFDMHALPAFFTLLALPSFALSADSVDYARDIKPILTRHCVKCHGANKPKNDLRLDAGVLVLRGGNSGPAIIARDSGKSRLIKAVSGGGGNVVAMPPRENDRLAAKEIALLKAWIDEGANVPQNEVVERPKKSDHWAFRGPVRPELPAVNNGAWTQNAIDRFILARLEKEGLAPSREAERVTLIRRLSLDLIGLPPTLKEIDDFLGDQRPGAYERVVDRLLASPHYGERWGRHWLDLARYADSNGFNIDAPRSIWPYRDWVIDAFNRDLPFDRFVIEQIAGDLLPSATTANKVATGFHRNTLINQEGGIDLEQFRVESVVDRVNTTGAVFLGLTLGCAQCHDHKYDPFSQRDYYQLFAFFNQCDEPNLPLPTPEQARQLADLRRRQADIQKALKGLVSTSPERQAEWERNLTPEIRKPFPMAIKDILDKPDYQRTSKEKQTLAVVVRNIDQTPQLLAGLGDSLPGGLASPALIGSHLHAILFRSNLEKKLSELKKQEPAIVTTMVLAQRKKSRETTIHIQGDFLRKGRPVSPATPEALHSLAGNDKLNRLDLARWLVDRQNPLTARVWVNRVWQQYFGLGLVETENDFGVQGTPPSHPELLDWLALEFMSPSTPEKGNERSGPAWSTKRLHRLIVTSATYRQSSKARAELANVDPRNRFLGRQNRLRLEAEAVRDVALGACGLLNPKIGGPSVFPPQPDGVFAFTQVKRDWKEDTGADRYRRGLYTHFWRSAPHPALMAFDAPDSTSTCMRRNRSNTPLQALTLLNDKAFVEFAQALAVRILKECDGNDSERLAHAFRLCLARTPTQKESARMLDLLGSLRRELAANTEEVRKLAPSNLPGQVAADQAAAWTLVARVLLNLDEFITRE